MYLTHDFRVDRYSPRLPQSNVLKIKNINDKFINTPFSAHCVSTRKRRATFDEQHNRDVEDRRRGYSTTEGGELSSGCGSFDL